METKSTYRFISDVEPTDEELRMIMHEVAVEAKEKANRTKIKIADQINAHIRQARQSQ